MLHYRYMYPAACKEKDGESAARDSGFWVLLLFDWFFYIGDGSSARGSASVSSMMSSEAVEHYCVLDAAPHDWWPHQQ